MVEKMGKKGRSQLRERKKNCDKWNDALIASVLTWIGNPEPIRLFQHSCSCVSSGLISGTFRIRRKPPCHRNNCTDNPRNSNGQDDLKRLRCWISKMNWYDWLTWRVKTTPPSAWKARNYWNDEVIIVNFGWVWDNIWAVWCTTWQNHVDLSNAKTGGVLFVPLQRDHGFIPFSCNSLSFSFIGTWHLCWYSCLDLTYFHLFFLSPPPPSLLQFLPSSPTPLIPNPPILLLFSSLPSPLLPPPILLVSFHLLFS